MKTVSNILTDALAEKAQKKLVAHQIAPLLVEMGRAHGYAVSLGGPDEFPDVTFEKQGIRSVLYLDRDGSWKENKLSGATK
jgi:hypothetical protein